jgi:hypothetical protein
MFLPKGKIRPIHKTDRFEISGPLPTHKVLQGYHMSPVLRVRGEAPSLSQHSLNPKKQEIARELDCFKVLQASA